MNEAEWFAETDTAVLLRHVCTTAGTRKFQLYMCAGCTRIAHLFIGTGSVRAIEIVERYADGKASDDDLSAASWYAEAPTFGYDFEPDFWERYPDPDRQAETVSRLVQLGSLNPSALSGGEWVVNPAMRSRILAAAELVYSATVCRPVDIDSFLVHVPDVDWPGRWLIDCIFGNPFRPVTPDPAWLTDTVVQLARGMYESRDFAAMPILADSLQDAGCDNPDILDHCRGPGPHARGCWVVDLVLGKS